MVNDCGRQVCVGPFLNLALEPWLPQLRSPIQATVLVTLFVSLFLWTLRGPKNSLSNLRYYMKTLERLGGLISRP